MPSISRTFLVALACAAFVLRAPSSAMAQADHAKLREQLLLPRIDMMVAYTFGVRAEILPEVASVEAKFDAAQLRKSLKEGADPEGWWRLSQLYERTEDHPHAAEAARTAAALFDKEVKNRPADWQLQMRFGQVLVDAERDGEGEAAIRKAGELAPHEWQPKAALGECLFRETLSDLYGAGRGYISEEDAWSKAFSTGRPTDEKIAQARRRIKEGAEAMNRAVDLAPREPGPYLRRAAFKTQQKVWAETFLDSLAKYPPGKSVDWTQFRAAMQAAKFEPAALADASRAVEVAPDSVDTIATEVLLNLLGAVAESGATYGTSSFWTRIPASSRKRFQDRMADLRRISAGTDKSIASRAFALLGFLQYTVTSEGRAAEEAYRKSLEADPNRAEAYEALTGLLISQSRLADLIPLMQARVKARPSTRNHFLLAKAYEKNGRMRDAEAQIDAALAIDPDDMLAGIGKAVLQMKSGDDADTFQHAGEGLKRISEIYATSRRTDVYVPLSVATAIYYGLTDRPDEARSIAKRVLEYDVDNEQAKAILAALKA
jgi:tetratricopeptide (TPR) repeat protein